MRYGRPSHCPMFSTSVRDGRGGDERCEWTTAWSSSISDQPTGSRKSSNRYGDAALFTAGTYSTAFPFSSSSRPHDSFGASARAWAAMASRIAGAHERAARAEAGDEHVDAVERLGDLGARAFVVRARVGRVRVLERHEVPRVVLRQLQREPNGAVRSFGARRLDDGRAVQAQQAPSLLRRVLREHARERVALQLRDERERDPSVAARRLEQLAAGLELPRRLGGVDHRLRDAVLDGAGRILPLELREDARAAAWRQALQLDERGLPDEIGERPGSDQATSHRPWPAAG